MGIREIASNLVAKVEAMVQEQGGDTGAVGKIDTENEKSIFAEELNKQSVTYKDAKEIWGFAKSAEAKDAPTNAPARAAAQTRAASGDKIVININNEINWYININIDVNLSKELEALIAKLIANQNENSEKLIAFLEEKFKELGEDQDTRNNLVLAAIKELYNKFEGCDYDQLMALITDIANKFGYDINQLKDLIGQLVQNSYEVLEMMGIELNKINESVKGNTEMMALINEAILQLTTNFDEFSETQVAQINKLIEMVAKGNITLEEMLALLKSIKADTSENCEVGKKLLELVDKYGVKMTTELTNIYNLLVEKGEDDKAVQKDFLEILKAIKDDTGTIRETNMKILEAIGKLDGKLVDQMTKMYNLILKQGEDIEAKLDEFLELLKNIQGAIDKLGNTVVEGITNVVEAINNKKLEGGDTTVTVDLSGIEAMFEKLLAEIQKGNQIDADGFNAVLDKLRELIDQVGEIDLTNIETLLNDIKTLTKENGDSLKNVLLNQDTMKMILENFKNELLKQEKIEEGQLDTIIELLMKKINAGHGCDVNGAELMAKLQEILEAIKNVKCECDCDHNVDDDSNNESIIEDLDKIFMARSRNNMTGIDNVTGDSTGTVTVNGQEYVVGKKYMVDGQVCIATPRGLYTTAGVKVAEPD